MLLLRAWLALIEIDLHLWRGNFNAIYRKVRECRVAHHRQLNTLEKVCSAVDLACIWYPRHVLCLQRSAALTCLLRREGVAAQMIIGAQRLPFRAHAWVEVNGAVINDKPYLRQMYGVLETC